MKTIDPADYRSHSFASCADPSLSTGDDVYTYNNTRSFTLDRQARTFIVLSLGGHFIRNRITDGICPTVCLSSVLSGI